MNNDFFRELEKRQLVFQSSNPTAICKLLKTNKQFIYAGFDPTADSLHVGNLIPLIALRRFQLNGHKPIALLGGGTGMIGDPSGKSMERTLNEKNIIDSRIEKIRIQIEKIVDFSKGKYSGILENNYSWIADINLIEYLRDIGKYFSVNSMMSKESVKSRINRESEGISYTEFSYMLLQAYDFLMLNKKYGCRLQIGGSDQWGNMVSGIDLIKRKRAIESYVITFPLLTTHDNKKFGKSEVGAIWLDPERTSPYEYYQFWINVDDKDVIKFMKIFTLISVSEIDKYKQNLINAPGKRESQKKLAFDMTNMLHGQTETQKVVRASESLFGSGNISSIDENTLNSIAKSAPCALYKGIKCVPPLTNILVDTGLVDSNSQARNAIKSGGVYINNIRINKIGYIPSMPDFLFGKKIVVRRGKKSYAICSLDTKYQN